MQRSPAMVRLCLTTSVAESAVCSRSARAAVGDGEHRLEPEHGIVAIGSGGPYAQAAARALLQHSDLSPAEIVRQSLTIAGELCIYTNQNLAVSYTHLRAHETPEHLVCR